MLRVWGCRSGVKKKGEKYKSGDVVGCGYNIESNCVYFTKNGKIVGVTEKCQKSSGKLQPTLSVQDPVSEGVVIKILSQEEYLFGGWDSLIGRSDIKKEDLCLRDLELFSIILCCLAN